MAVKKCKYCDKPAKINYGGVKRIHKGYLRTCGSRECLGRQYKDTSVNQKKAYVSRNIKTNCSYCGIVFVKESHNQKWCKVCVPNKIARAIMQRYCIPYSQYLKMLSVSARCPICSRDLNNPVIDHDHKNGKIRGIICNHCNTALSIIEDTEKLKRALDYLRR